MGRDEWGHKVKVQGHGGIKYASNSTLGHRRIGDRGQRGPKIREKYFSGNYYVKFWHFFG